MRGFTLVEAVVITGIMVLFTAIALANLPAFNQRLLLKTEIGKIASAIRKAQTYALAVREFSPGSNLFPGYGVFIDISSGPAVSYLVFGDSFDDDPPGEGGVKNRYDSGKGEQVELFSVASGARIISICGDGNCALKTLDLVYLRPSPSLVITGCESAGCSLYKNVELKIASLRDPNITKSILILPTGQVSIQQ